MLLPYSLAFYIALLHQWSRVFRLPVQSCPNQRKRGRSLSHLEITHGRDALLCCASKHFYSLDPLTFLYFITGWINLNSRAGTRADCTWPRRTRTWLTPREGSYTFTLNSNARPDLRSLAVAAAQSTLWSTIPLETASSTGRLVPAADPLRSTTNPVPRPEV